MYGDTEVMRRHVDQLREQGVDVRQLADHLVGQADSIAWSGRAAEAMRERARARATALRECASRYDTAADALDRHADDIDHLKDVIALRERKAGALITDALARTAPIVGEGDGARRPSEEDRVLAAFTPPAAGHRDWLTVELPGL